MALTSRGDFLIRNNQLKKRQPNPANGLLLSGARPSPDRRGGRQPPGAAVVRAREAWAVAAVALLYGPASAVGATRPKPLIAFKSAFMARNLLHRSRGGGRSRGPE